MLVCFRSQPCERSWNKRNIMSHIWRDCLQMSSGRKFPSQNRPLRNRPADFRRRKIVCTTHQRLIVFHRGWKSRARRFLNEMISANCKTSASPNWARLWAQVRGRRVKYLEILKKCLCSGEIAIRMFRATILQWSKLGTRKKKRLMI